jgi:hypothetical protein
MVKSLLLSLALLWFGAPESGFEQLKGFETVLVNQINTDVGSTRLPTAMGYPVEPGVYATLGMNVASIYDRQVATLNGGTLANTVAAKNCRSGCSAVFYGAFRRAWMELREEADGLQLDVPTRLMFAADSQLPAATLVDASYAASEARPMQPPALYLLLNSGKAGLRARPYYLMPPGGLRSEAGDRLLGLRVRIEMGGRFQMSAIDPRFPRNTSGTGPEELKAVFKDIKKRYPGKETIIIDAGPGTNVGDIVSVMAIAAEPFPNVVLAASK